VGKQAQVYSGDFYGRAEYVAAAMATKEALWPREVLLTLCINGGAVPMGEDNQA